MSTTQPFFQIQLHNVRLYGYHGLYEEEKRIGNEFEINISMKVAAAGERLSLTDTINYADVFTLVKAIFQTPEELLENLCINIASATKQAFPQLLNISVQVIKLQPPITGFIGSVSSTYVKEFTHNG